MGNDSLLVPQLAHTPPERLLAGAPASPAADVFSLGVILWELLAGQPAWDGLKPMALIQAIVRQKAALPPAPNCPPALQALVASCTSPHPAQRPSCAFVLQQLEAMLRDPALAA